MRLEIIEALDIAVQSGARISKACEAILLCQRRLRRWKNLPEDRRIGGYYAKSQRLSEVECQSIVSHFESDEYAGLPRRIAHAKLMDQGVYIASPSTCIRVLNQNGPQKKTRISHIKRVKPELSADAPNQVWCWDITWIPTHIRGKYFYLYLIIDMYSRFIVDWEVHSIEDGTLARSLFMRAIEARGVLDDKLVVHADNGASMRSKTLNTFFTQMSVIATHSRPHTSNDNAYAESVFSTLKGRLLYPEYFKTIEACDIYIEQFVQWYNYEHQHSSLDYLRPFEVHESEYKDILIQRNAMVNKNRLEHANRHGGKKKIYQIAKIVQLKHKVTCHQTN